MPKDPLVINPPVPAELRELAETATAALKTHTAEGKALLLQGLRERFDEGVKELRDAGMDKAIPDETIIKVMQRTFGHGLSELVAKEWKKATEKETNLDGLPENVRGFGKEKAVRNMAELVGAEAARAVFTEMFNKAFFEGYSMAWAIFVKFKDDVLVDDAEAARYKTETTPNKADV